MMIRTDRNRGLTPKRPQRTPGPSMPHPAPPRALVEAVRARYPLWQNISLDHVAQARQHPLPWLLKTIEEMYDSRYAHDVAELEYIAGGDPDDADELIGAHPFPEYVQSYCGRQYGVKALAEKAAWEVMCNAEAARSAGLHTSVDLFCAFCNRGYDDEELMFFLYCRQTLLQECSRALPQNDHMAPKGADKRFVSGMPVPPMCSAIELTETRAKNITRAVFGKNGGGVLYQAVRQLVTDYFRERRDALESEASGEPYAEAPKATMEAYYYLKLMLSAYRDTRPDNADDDGEFSYDDEEYEEEAVYRASFDASPRSASGIKDWGGESRRTNVTGGSTATPASFVTAQQKMDGGTRGHAATPANEAVDVDAESPAAAAVESTTKAMARSSIGKSQKSSSDPKGESVRVVRRAITESCGKYCDVLLQVAQDLPPLVLAELKRKAVTALDGHSQELFSGSLAAAFGADSGNGAGPGGAGRIAQTEPDVVAAVAKSVTALLRKAQSGADPAESGAEAREVARLVLASRTIRSHVEPLLTRLLSELDDEETSGIVE
mmetsp:Transcript_6231/g.28098  ORF Transcript_6231/g.28098 Transcript_6231/m.28098 type:complete len:550 (-) Transcript_6231:60-1709(-)